MRLNGTICALAAGLLLAVSLPSCHHVDDKRTPPVPVWIAFPSQPVWEFYGVSGALDYKEFIKPLGIPEPSFFTAMSQTGYGGVLLVCDINNTPLAYDLSCPVENSADVRVKIDSETHEAYCPVCHSRYEVFTNYGTPVAGPAAERGYGLTKYLVGAGPNGEYRVITR
ncbi:MAG: hypothetical protein K2L62_00225 [Muribaculaceae bacterium]|nr:hypothetical protein [Muribaculaceae bacterium]